MLDGLSTELIALLVGSLASLGFAKSRSYYASRKHTGHLFAMRKRTNGIRVIIPALRISESVAPDNNRVSLQTTVEGMAYGWLLKACLPFTKKDERIECQLAHRGSLGGENLATVLLGGTANNEITAQFLADFIGPTVIGQKSEFGYSILHDETEYSSEMRGDVHTGDFAFLAFDPDQQIIACFGTSPFGTAGAVSMLVESNRKRRTDLVAKRISDNRHFLAIGRVRVSSETDWYFDRVVDIYAGKNCQERIEIDWTK